ncbi:Protein kinase domain-containing protein [Plasmodiophora brassicae]
MKGLDPVTCHAPLGVTSLHHPVSWITPGSPARSSYPNSWAVTMRCLVKRLLPSFHRSRRRTPVEKDFDLLERLDKDASISEVRLGVERNTGREVAVKTVVKRKRPKTDQEEAVFRLMHHENLVSLVDVYEDSKNVYFIMERCLGGDLIDFVEARGGRLPEHDVVEIMRQLVNAVAFMHDRHIVHGDIKPSNIMIDWTSHPGCLKVKLIDFGASHILDENDDATTRVTQGSPEFMAPEAVERGETSVKSDIWSIGIVLFVMLAGFNPFNPRAENTCAMHRLICNRVRCGFDGCTKSGYGPFFPEAIPISPAYKKLITALLNRDPRRRPSAKALLSHPLISRNDADQQQAQAMPLTTPVPTMQKSPP